MRNVNIAIQFARSRIPTKHAVPTPVQEAKLSNELPSEANPTPETMHKRFFVGKTDNLIHTYASNLL